MQLSTLNIKDYELIKVVNTPTQNPQYCTSVKQALTMNEDFHQVLIQLKSNSKWYVIPTNHAKDNALRDQVCTAVFPVFNDNHFIGVYARDPLSQEKRDVDERQQLKIVKHLFTCFSLQKLKLFSNGSLIKVFKLSVSANLSISYNIQDHIVQQDLKSRVQPFFTDRKHYCHGECVLVKFCDKPKLYVFQKVDLLTIQTHFSVEKAMDILFDNGIIVRRVGEHRKKIESLLLLLYEVSAISEGMLRCQGDPNKHEASCDKKYSIESQTSCFGLFKKYKIYFRKTSRMSDNPLEAHS